MLRRSEENLPKAPLQTGLHRSSGTTLTAQHSTQVTGHVCSAETLNFIGCIACRALQSLSQCKQRAAGAWAAHETFPAGSPQGAKAVAAAVPRGPATAPGTAALSTWRPGERSSASCAHPLLCFGMDGVRTLLPLLVPSSCPDFSCMTSALLPFSSALDITQTLLLRSKHRSVLVSS